VELGDTPRERLALGEVEREVEGVGEGRGAITQREQSPPAALLTM